MNTLTIAGFASAAHCQLPLEELHPHPKNPRIEPRADIVAQLAARMADGFDPSHALIVRPIEDGYEIISGHHRALAAQQAGLTEVPCWVREMSDDDAYMQLVLCNTQSELHPLEVGKHAVESGRSMAEYAEKLSESKQNINLKANAYEVYSLSRCQDFAIVRDRWSCLAEIKRAPEWLWPALVSRMVADAWTVAATRTKVGAVKEASDLPEWADSAALANDLLAGVIKLADLGRFAAVVKDAVVRGKRRKAMTQELHAKRPRRLSDVQAIIAYWEDQQAAVVTRVRSRAQRRQQSAEQAQQRVAELRRSVSLDVWKTLSADEQALLLAPPPGDGGALNKQDSKDIEWAQWSWNPVTGCLHVCPYCYARDSALNDKKLKPYYPNGFDPTFRSQSLNAPKNTTVPKEAATDTRYRNVFTCSMADLFGRWVPVEWINAVMLAVRGNPQWNFLFLTKFPQRFAELEIPTNAWMGTTVDMQARVKNAEKAFANLKTGVRWLSVEPMIEPIKLSRPDLFNWVVIGGASSSRSNSTPAWHPPYRWIESLVRQCDEAGVPVYMKSNLGIANRVLALPFDAPLSLDPQEAPAALRYLPERAA